MILVNSTKEQLTKITTFHNSDLKSGLKIQRKEGGDTKESCKVQIWAKSGRVHAG